MSDPGNVGGYNPKILGEGSLNEIRDICGQPPVEGKKWAMVNLDTGEVKWYRASRRRSYGGGGGGGYQRRSYRRY